MFFRSTYTTQQLERFARKFGENLGIVASEGNSAGLYFVANIDNRPLSHWIPIGWTRSEAESRIGEIAAVHQETKP